MAEWNDPEQQIHWRFLTYAFDLMEFIFHGETGDETAGKEFIK